MALTKIGTDGVKDDAITSGKIPANAVGSSEIADQAVTLDKLPHGTSSNDGKFLRANNGADPTFETVTSTTINNNASTRFITGSNSANTLDAESNLTYNNNLVTFADSSLTINKSTSPTVSAKETAGNKEIQLRANTTGGLLRTVGSYPLVLGTNQTERMRIASDGKIGIGNPNPVNFVDIHRGQDEENILIVRGQDTSGEYCALGVNGNDAIVTGGGVSGNNTNLVFRTAPNGNETEQMRLNSSGQLNIGVVSPQYPKTVNIQGGNDSTLSISNQDYTGHAAGSMSGIEGRVQCGNNIWSTAGIRFKKKNGTAGDKHTELELYATDGYQNQTGFSIQPDGEVNHPKQPMALIYSNSGDPGASNNKINNDYARFTGVHLNVGNNYSVSTGKFTCPVDGVYGVAFTSNLNMSNLSVGQNMNIQTRRNQQIHMYNYNSTFTQGWQQMTFTNFINCNANDELQFYFNASAAFGADQGSGRWGQMYFWLQQ